MYESRVWEGGRRGRSAGSYSMVGLRLAALFADHNSVLFNFQEVLAASLQLKAGIDEALKCSHAMTSTFSKAAVGSL